MNSDALISAGAGLLGVIVGGALTAYSQWRIRVSERRRDQMQNFYSPLLGLNEQISARSQLRTRLHSVAGARFTEIARTASENEKEAYTSIIDYSNDQVKQEILPAYEQMVTLFTDRLHLAEATTRGHSGKLVDFVELWRRHLANPLPAAVVQDIGHSEAWRAAFIEYLKSNFIRLQKKLG